MKKDRKRKNSSISKKLFQTKSKKIVKEDKKNSPLSKYLNNFLEPYFQKPTKEYRNWSCK